MLQSCVGHRAALWNSHMAGTSPDLGEDRSTAGREGGQSHKMKRHLNNTVKQRGFSLRSGKEPGSGFYSV